MSADTSTSQPSWATGLATLRARQRRLPDLVADGLAARDDVPRLDDLRAVVTTGVGSSLAHARYLSWLLRERCALPSWSVPTGSFLSAPPVAARDQALVVFSQGLSPNARFPLAHARAYRRVVLVTAADGDSEDRARVAQRARDEGVVVLPLRCEPEYEVLLRIIGPMLGYGVALGLANASGASVSVDPEWVSSAVRDATERMRDAIAGMGAAILAEPITLVATHGYAELAHNLAAKVQEGMYLPWPAMVDALELAHGTIQEAHDKARTFLALARGAPLERELFARARATLAPQHRWLEAEARLSEPLAIFEHEAMLNELVLAAVEARQLDQAAWPGKGHDGPLYSLGSVDDLATPAPNDTP